VPVLAAADPNRTGLFGFPVFPRRVWRDKKSGTPDPSIFAAGLLGAALLDSALFASTLFASTLGPLGVDSAFGPAPRSRAG
jgi:hypothetical protein